MWFWWAQTPFIVRSLHPFLSYGHRSDHKAGRDEEAAFLSNLDSLWQGLIHMHAVAKFMTKAFPVSGTLDNLTEVDKTSVELE